MPSAAKHENVWQCPESATQFVVVMENETRHNRMTKITKPFSGGCACGAIRYECTADPIMMFKCHCRDCQRVTGGGFVPGLLIPRSAFRLTKGELRYHFTPSLA